VIRTESEMPGCRSGTTRAGAELRPRATARQSTRAPPGQGRRRRAPSPTVACPALPPLARQARHGLLRRLSPTRNWSAFHQPPRAGCTARAACGFSSRRRARALRCLCRRCACRNGNRRRPARSSRADLVIVCDIFAWRRGHTHPAEVCQVIGGGPIPVELARELGKDAFLKAVCTTGLRSTPSSTWGVTSLPSYEALWTSGRSRLSQEHSVLTAGAASASSTITSTRWQTRRDKL